MKLFKRRSKPVRKSRRRNVLETLETRKLFAADLGSAPPDMLATPYAFVGDHSPSNSEKWSMQVGQTTLQASDFGEVERQRLSLEKGKSYPITVSHIDTNIEEDGEKKPDYDYRAWIDDSANPAWTSGPSTPSSDEWFVENSSGLLQRKFWGDDSNEATGSATLHVPLADLDIDSNNNGAFDENDDWIELDSRSGRLVDVLVGDIDDDGIEDRNDLNGIAGASFEPIKLSLSSNLAQAGSGVFDVTINYDMADAAGNGGDFRLWKVDASADRSDLGSLVRSGTTMSASSLGLSPGGSITLYLEAVNDTRNTVHFEEISVDIDVSASFFYGTLSDSLYAGSVVPDSDAVPEITQLAVFDSASQETDAIDEGEIGSIRGTVKYARDVSQVDVTLWTDHNFNGQRDSGEETSVHALPTGQNTISGDRFYAFVAPFSVADDGPSPGNYHRTDRLALSAKPSDGTDFETSVSVANVDPEFVSHPKLATHYSHTGEVAAVTVYGTFVDQGVLDEHLVEIRVDGGVTHTRVLQPGISNFSIPIGNQDFRDGAKITINLYDDDSGLESYYITVGSVVTKSFIDNIYTTGGVGSVTYRDAITNTYGHYAAQAANSRLQGFAVGSFAQFREHPVNADRDKGYRLYSRQDYAIGSDGHTIQYIDKLLADYDAGTEAYIFSGQIESAEEYQRLSGPTKATAGFSAYGQPEPLLEIGFDSVMERTSTNIWHVIEVDATLQGNWANFAISDTDSSAFPSNKVWINESEVEHYEQATFVSLWQSSPKYGKPFVVGRDEAGFGVFEYQTNTVGGIPVTWWLPEEEGFV